MYHFSSSRSCTLPSVLKYYPVRFPLSLMTQPQQFFAPLTYNSNREICLNMKESLAGVAVLGTLLAGCSGATASDATVPTEQHSSEAAMMPASESSSAATTKSAMSETARQKYKNGTFSALGDYQSPAGMEEITVSLTLKNGVVTDASYKGTATQPKSKKMQEAFGAGYKQLVVGKSIDSLSLDVVNGSSLTPIGFLDAVKKIQAEAAAS